MGSVKYDLENHGFNDCNELEKRAEAADFHSDVSISLTRERLRALSFFG